MVKLVTAIVTLGLASAAVAAIPTVRTMYVDAVAKERAVRTALADETASESVLKAVRTAVGAYEALVRHYPNSSYSDNALWQGGRLSLEAYTRFGQPQDKDAGVRLLSALASQYPASKLARQVPQVLAGVREKPLEAPPSPPAVVAESPRAALPVATGGPAKPEPSSTSRPATTAARATPIGRSRVATISGIKRAVLPDGVRITIQLDNEVPFHDERIAGPSRIFVDLRSARAAPPLVDQTLRFNADGDVVSQVRIGRHPNATTRVVLDATGVSSYSIYPLYSPYRLVIDCVRTTSAGRVPAAGGRINAVAVARPLPPPEPPRSLIAKPLAEPLTRAPAVAPLSDKVLTTAYTARTLTGRPVRTDWRSRLPAVKPRAAAMLEAAYAPRPLASRRVTTEWGRRLPAAPSRASTALADARAPATIAPDALAAVPLPAAKVPAPPIAAAPNPGSGYSMARQLGLGVSRIVIDPGHGGHDPGAKGKGITEAELVLDVALRLEKLLQAASGFDVILTRRTDGFVGLQERTAIANREGADLFLSIHANASANLQARGIETYFLNFANNFSAAAVAARENAMSGQPMGALPDFVKAIALNNKLDESRDFATLIQHAMVERLRAPNKAAKNLGVKQAPFVVLIGASMPSVLAEVSFLTNAQEAKLLKGSEYRQRIAEALFDGISKYRTSLSRVETAAHQD